MSSSPDFSRPIGISSRTSLRNSNSTYPKLDSISFHNSNNSHYFNYYRRRIHSLQCTLEMVPQNTCSSPSETWISSLIPPSHFPSSALYSTSTALQSVNLSAFDFPIVAILWADILSCSSQPSSLDGIFAPSCSPPLTPPHCNNSELSKT